MHDLHETITSYNMFFAAVVAAIALAGGWVLRYRGERLDVGQRALPWELAWGRLMGIATWGWGIGVLAGVMRPLAATDSGVHLEVLAALAMALCGSAAIWRAAWSATSRRWAYGLHHVLLWGGVMSGQHLILRSAEYSAFWGVWGLGVLGAGVALMALARRARSGGQI